MNDWQEEYKRKLISAQEAANLIKSGDVVSFTLGREAHSIGLAIAARVGELKDVKVFQPFPGYDFGWYDPGWQESFQLTISMPTAVSQQMVDNRRCDIGLPDILGEGEATLEKSDVVITEVSPPDAKGFCSFGAALWNKKKHIKKGRLVLAEVNNNLIRTYGDNYVHVSEIDYFVPHQPSGISQGSSTLAGRDIKAVQPYMKDICGYVSELIKDGDTIQIGVGRVTEHLIEMGLLAGKHDIGWYSEATPPGAIRLVREGIINGARKTLLPGKAIATSMGGASRDDMEWASNNPLFWLINVEFLWDVRNISANDNMVAINQALMVDFWGQVSASSIGFKLYSGAGGQTAFAWGSIMSRGGRGITVIPSTARTPDGQIVSRIVPSFEEGTVITVPSNVVDNVVTEYGVARLRGKSRRRRVDELITVAHPDFRAELRKKANKLFWP
jgi:4-hydroxybutyrate CoA-transferase